MSNLNLQDKDFDEFVDEKLKEIIEKKLTYYKFTNRLSTQKRQTIHQMAELYGLGHFTNHQGRYKCNCVYDKSSHGELSKSPPKKSSQKLASAVSTLATIPVQLHKNVIEVISSKAPSPPPKQQQQLSQEEPQPTISSTMVCNLRNRKN